MKEKTNFHTAWAYPEKLFIAKVNEWRYMRPVVKASKCSRCGTCKIYCPTGCIEETGRYYGPNLDYCKGCGICAQVCPVSAVKMVMEV